MRRRRNSIGENEALGCVLLFIIAFMLISHFWTKTDDVLVVDHQWRMEQQIEDFQARGFEGWDDTVPSDAYNVSCTGRMRGKLRDNYCTYTAERWGWLTSYVNTGSLSDPILAPEPSVRCNDVPEIGCERYGQLIRTFTIFWQRVSDGSEFSCDYDRALWTALETEHVYTMVFGVIGNEMRCEVRRDLESP